MCLRFQFCTHQRVCILYFLKKSQIRCTLRTNQYLRADKKIYKYLSVGTGSKTELVQVILVCFSLFLLDPRSRRKKSRIRNNSKHPSELISKFLELVCWFKNTFFGRKKGTKRGGVGGRKSAQTIPDRNPNYSSRHTFQSQRLLA